MSEPLLPAYGSGALSDVWGAVAASAGVPGAVDVLGLPAAQRWVVFLVDGLGWEQVRGLGRELPYLGPLLAAGRPITAAVPATTVTSITSLGTGLVPGEHGIAGYRFRLPGRREAFSPLLWDTREKPMQVQPRPTWPERLRDVLPVTAVQPARFATSGLTGVALRGARCVGLDDEHDAEERVRLIVDAFREPGPRIVYGYDRHLDHTGHGHGVGDWRWLDALQGIDEYLGDLRAALPPDVRLLVTGDHGMIDVAQQHRLVLEDDPTLAAGLDQVGGEGRFRHLYTDDPAGVAARWRRVLGERAWVRTREEAVEEGWFGPMAPANAPRFGDVVVAMRERWAVMTTTVPKEWNLVGMHASLTPDEMLVPLLLDPTP